MAFVAGFALIVYGGDEEAAFAVTTFMLDWILGPLLGQQGPGPMTETFDAVIKSRLPKLWERFAACGIPSCVFTTSWSGQ
jgi:hypothetical protein